VIKSGKVNPMYIINDGAPQEVRVSKKGNLVDTDGGHGRWPTGMGLFGRVGQEATWPTTYATIEAAWEAQHAVESTCHHQWQVVDHEEDRCVRCGAFRFIPDL